MKMDKSIIGQNIDAMRKERKMTIEQLADATHFDTRSVAHHLKKGVNSVDTLFVYAEALKCDISAFFIGMCQRSYL